MTIASPGLQTGEWNTMCRAERIFNKPKNKKRNRLGIGKVLQIQSFYTKIVSRKDVVKVKHLVI